MLTSSVAKRAFNPTIISSPARNSGTVSTITIVASTLALNGPCVYAFLAQIVNSKPDLAFSRPIRRGGGPFRGAPGSVALAFCGLPLFSNLENSNPAISMCIRKMEIGAMHEKFRNIRAR
jgi:hypothetical protein